MKISLAVLPSVGYVAGQNSSMEFVKLKFTILTVFFSCRKQPFFLLWAYESGGRKHVIQDVQHIHNRNVYQKIISNRFCYICGTTLSDKSMYSLMKPNNTVLPWISSRWVTFMDHLSRPKLLLLSMRWIAAVSTVQCSNCI